LRAVFEFRTKKPIWILPLVGLRHTLVFGLALVSVACVLEQCVLPATGAWFHYGASPEWIAENERVNRNNNHKSIFVVWDSRGHPLELPPEDHTTVLVVGDSFVWGDGYANLNDLWWRRLETVLHDRGYRDLTVLGLGRNDFSTRDQIHAVREVAPSLRPDIIVWGYVSNDPNEGLVPQADDLDAWASYREGLVADDFWYSALESMADPFPRLSERLCDARFRKLSRQSPPPPGVGFEYYEWERALLRGDNFERFGETVAELEELVKATDTPIFFVTLPVFPSLRHYSERFAPVLALYCRYRLTVHDLLQPFVAPFGDRIAPESYWGINPANGHPGRVATTFYAEQVADILERDFLDLLPPIRTEAPPFPVRFNDWMPSTLPMVQTGDEVLFVYPDDPHDMLRMPSGEPFVQFSLRHPVAYSEIHLRGDYLLRAEVEVTLEPAEEGPPTVYSGGWLEGAALVWGIDAFEHTDRLSTIRIRAEFGTEGDRPGSAWVIEPDLIQPYEPVGGYAYSVQLPEGFILDQSERSLVWLFEDRGALGPPVSDSDVVRAMGNGRYHLEGSPPVLVFSARANSDPRNNGHQYAVSTPEHFARTLALRVELLGSSP
jgi:hypothetical protein